MLGVSLKEMRECKAYCVYGCPEYGWLYVEDFTNTNAILGTLSYLAEPAFSDDRGWPTCCTFYQNRLVLGGTTSLPAGIWLSAINDFFNFDSTVSNASDTIGTYLRGNRDSVVQNVLGQNVLLGFTTLAPFSTASNFGEPITPDNSPFFQQGDIGVADIQPVHMDNQFFFVDKGGQIIRSANYDIVKQSFNALDISDTTDIVQDPIRLSTYENPTVDDGSFLLIVNADGSLALLTSVAEQQIQAWSPHTTDGQFRLSIDSNDNVWFIVEREIDGETVFYLEQLDFTLYNDCAITGSFALPQNTISGLAYLSGKTAQVKGDGKYFGTFDIDDTGIVELPEDITDYEVGLAIDFQLTPMPVNVDTQTGPNLYYPKRINSIYLDYYESLGLSIDGKEVPNLQIPLALDTAPALQSGFYRSTIMKGWEPFASFDITQSVPYPFLIRAIAMEVDINTGGG